VATPDEAINTIREVGGAQPGYRALHAKGKLYRGTFTAAADAAQLSRAAHLTGSAVPALIRFSSGSGNPKQPDNAPGVRGMAVKFTLPDGSTTDVSTQTAKLFPASTPDGFISLLGAMRPGITAPLRLAGYVATHPRFLTVLPVLRDANRVPASYGTVAYHGLHAFRWVAADGGARFVRYHLLPAGAAKSTAVAFHSRARGYSREQTFAVGDSRERDGIGKTATDTIRQKRQHSAAN